MKGYKTTLRGSQTYAEYEVGKVFQATSGSCIFTFYEKLKDAIYFGPSDHKDFLIYEIESLENVHHHDNHLSICNKMEILRIIPLEEYKHLL